MFINRGILVNNIDVDACFIAFFRRKRYRKSTDSVYTQKAIPHTLP
jgi:hypothetical protein